MKRMPPGESFGHRHSVAVPPIGPASGELRLRLRVDVDRVVRHQHRRQGRAGNYLDGLAAISSSRGATHEEATNVTGTFGTTQGVKLCDTVDPLSSQTAQHHVARTAPHVRRPAT